MSSPFNDWEMVNLWPQQTGLPIRVGERCGSQVITAAIDPPGTKHPRYRVRCDCGFERIMKGGSFRSVLGCKNCRPGGPKPKYGNNNTKGRPLYRLWVGMRRRCRVDQARYKSWFGRGIIVCDEWKENYKAFEEWSLAHGYRKGLSLDRINVDGNYSPDNCQWVTPSENSKRTRASYLTVRREALVENFADGAGI